MKYYNHKVIHGSNFKEVKSDLIEALKEEGFGILTEIDLRDTMKKKLNKDYLPHIILGACNPVYADKVLSLDPNISTMLPCNVTIRELPEGEIEVASINPSMAMGAIGNKELLPLADEVQAKLLKVIERL